jgi:8-oxo-dGTP diphosphatase
MEVLLEQNDKTVGGRDYDLSSRHFLFRRAARAVIIDDQGSVGLMHLKKRGIYKLPGGGVDKGETIMQALIREVKEEVGVEFTGAKELGITLESRYYEEDDHGLFQMTYAYLVKLRGEKGEAAFTEEELAEGATVVWLPKEEALNVIINYPFPDYESHFIKQRELRILEEAKKYWDAF